MKSDRDLQKQVMDELAFDPSVTSEHIGVSVKDRVVTLSGTVPTFGEKYAAEKWLTRLRKPPKKSLQLKFTKKRRE